VQQESQSPLIRPTVSVCHQAEQIAILLLQVTLAKEDQPDLEAQHADLTGPLGVVDIQDPVDGQVQHQRQINFIDCHVERMQHRGHVGYVDQLVVLGPQAMSIEGLAGGGHADPVESC